jgi:hypothetical protein
MILFWFVLIHHYHFDPFIFLGIGLSKHPPLLIIYICSSVNCAIGIDGLLIATPWRDLSELPLCVFLLDFSFDVVDVRFYSFGCSWWRFLLSAYRGPINLIEGTLRFENL